MAIKIRFQSACMDEQAREEAGVQLLIDVLEHIGGWPVLKGDTQQKFCFLKCALSNVFTVYLNGLNLRKDW